LAERLAVRGVAEGSRPQRPLAACRGQANLEIR